MKLHPLRHFAVRKSPKGAGSFRKSGFSLLEMMVSVALLAVIIVGLLAMFYQVQRAFRAGTAQVDVMEGGRAAIRIIATELRELIAIDEPGVLNMLTYPGYSSGYPASYQAFPSGAVRTNWIQDVFFLSRNNDRVVATAYRVDALAQAAGTLSRLVTNAPLTNVANVAFNVTNWLSIPPSDPFPPDFHRVLDGVVHFRILPYDTNGFLITTNHYRDFSEMLPHGGYAFSSNTIPAFIEVELGVLEPSAYAKFKARAEIDVQRGTNYLHQQIGRVHLFRQRVYIRPSATDIGAGPRLALP